MENKLYRSNPRNRSLLGGALMFLGVAWLIEKEHFPYE